MQPTAPRVERRTTLQADSPPLTGAQLQDIKDGKKFSSRSDADAYLARLRRQVEATTATTVPPVTTAPPSPAAPPS